MKPAVVISAYNRPVALKRLLNSLQTAVFPSGSPIPLVISIDDADRHPDVAALADDFTWTNGPKQVICHKERFGPVEHFFACGNLAYEYDAIIYLEDDLVVSPVFYYFAEQALHYYGSDQAVAGISLYALWFNGYTQEPFIPLSDQTDTFFLQVPFTLGLGFSQAQWAGFHDWVINKAWTTSDTPLLHESWFRFRSDEWFPWLARYLVTTQKYFVLPRVSHISGFGDAGTHFTRSTRFFQIPLQRSKQHYSFQPLEESCAVYDSFFEILPDRLDRLSTAFEGYVYCVDLYATRSRQNIPADYVLTSRPCQRPILTFGKSMLPMEANIEYGVPGKEISFCRAEDVRWDWLSGLETRLSSSDYFARGRRTGLKTWLGLVLLSEWRKARSE